jgi:1L-myo-inositol 1-phosphate cytidylyltransferase
LIDLALILAAGRGIRFSGRIPEPHKALVAVAGQPLLVHTCRILQDLGIRQVIVVAGYQGDALRAAFDGRGDLRVKPEFVDNPQWEKANGLSVLAAADRLHSNYLLLMADHLFDPSIVVSLSRTPLGPGEVVLAVDRQLDRIYDMEDATKVRLSGGRITAIGKNLEEFSAVDTGLFACSEALVPALRRQLLADGDCSLSDGMRRLAQAGKLRYLDIGSAWWQDIDTPEALSRAQRLWTEHARTAAEAQR